MKTFRIVCPIVALFIWVSCAVLPNNRPPLEIGGLRCEYLYSPLGIDAARPRLGWIIESKVPGQRQTAYQLGVASSQELLARDRCDLWNSGKVPSDQSAQVEYGGKPLTSRLRCFWKVRVWDKDGKVSAWSKPSMWTMGLLTEQDWKAQWIGLDETLGGGMAPGGLAKIQEGRRLPARYLRREFAVGKGLRRATVSVCGLGLFELQFNGRKAGNHVLEPALTQYDKRAFYETFDVTDQLRPGSNAVGIVLGNGGFYAPRRTEPMATSSFDYPKALFQMDLDYAGGATAQLVSDDHWKLTTNGPIRANNEYDGEEYDARLEMNGWSQPGFDDSAWQPARIVAPGTPHKSAQMSEPIEVMETVHPAALTHPRPGVNIYDMGQNLVGWCRLHVSGPRGTRVTLRHAETLRPDGMLYLDNLRSAKATDSYTLRGLRKIT